MLLSGIYIWDLRYFTQPKPFKGFISKGKIMPCVCPSLYLGILVAVVDFLFALELDFFLKWQHKVCKKWKLDQ